MSYFPAATAEALARETITSSYPDQTVIFEEGEYPDALYLVLDGRVDLSKKTSSGRYQAITQIGEGEYFGEFGVFDGLPRSARATASGICRLAKIQRDVFLNTLKDVPAQTFVGLMMQIIKNLRQTNDRFMYEVVRKERMALLSEMAEAILRDFKTSFTIIHMVCSRVRGEMRTTSIHELCEVVDDQLRIMSEMSEEVLTLSRGSIALVKQQISLPDLFQRLTMLTRMILQEQKVRLKIEPTPITIEVDPDRMLRVLQGLMNKIVEGFGGRGGEITLKTHASKEGFDLVLHNDGPAASPDTTGNLFEPLSTSSGIRETGLGVALAKFIIEAHDGRLFIESGDKTGTSFILRFPSSIVKS